jgi:hypothetical protein
MQQQNWLLKIKKIINNNNCSLGLKDESCNELPILHKKPSFKHVSDPSSKHVSFPPFVFFVIWVLCEILGHSIYVVLKETYF